MRIPRAWIPLIAKSIITDLLKKELLEPKTSAEVLLSEAERIIADELMVEDRVNDEVREILKKHAAEIEKGRLDYRTVFDLTKKKIVRERGLIL